MISIIGGGFGGLVAARILQRHGREVTVYEKDVTRDTRLPARWIDILTESGLWALRRARLECEFLAEARPRPNAIRVITATGDVLHDDDGNAASPTVPEIDQKKLRAVLLDSLAPNTLHWDHALTCVDPIGPSGMHTLHFANGHTAQAEIVIGADGPRSRIRPMVTDAINRYSGISFIVANISHASERIAEVAQLAGRGTLFALAENQGILSHRHGDDSISLYIIFRIPENGFGALGIDFVDPAQTRQAVIARFAGWHPALRAMLAATDDRFEPRTVKALPFGLRRQRRPNVTLIGDAAHLRSPLSGAGANLAMQDGAELALALLQSSTTEEALASYEDGMFARADQKIDEAANCLEMCIGNTGAEHLARFMRSPAAHA